MSNGLRHELSAFRSVSINRRSALNDSIRLAIKRKLPKDTLIDLKRLRKLNDLSLETVTKLIINRMDETNIDFCRTVLAKLVTEFKQTHITDLNELK